MSPQLVVIPCGSRKLQERAPAAQLYTGAYFRACLRYAELRAPRVLILSALHGLVPLEAELEPYNLKMGAQGSAAECPRTLFWQAERLGVYLFKNVEVLGGQRYIAAARMVWPHAVAPIPSGLGIGRQLAWLRATRLQLEHDALRAEVMDMVDAVRLPR